MVFLWKLVHIDLSGSVTCVSDLLIVILCFGMDLSQLTLRHFLCWAKSFTEFKKYTQCDNLVEKL